MAAFPPYVFRRFKLNEPMDRNHPAFDPALHIDFVDELNAALAAIQAGDVQIPPELVKAGDSLTRLKLNAAPGTLVGVGEGGALVAVDAGASAVAQLTDVDLSTPPADQQTLLYDHASGKWRPGTVAADLSAYARKVDLGAFITAADLSAALSAYAPASGAPARVERVTVSALRWTDNLSDLNGLDADGQVVVSGGVASGLGQTNSDFAAATLKGVKFRDGWTEGTLEHGGQLSLRVQGENTRYAVSYGQGDGPTSVFLVLYQGSTTPGVLYQSGQQWAGPRRVRLTARGSTLSVHVDGALVATVTDATLGDPGGVGFALEPGGTVRALTAQADGPVAVQGLPSGYSLLSASGASGASSVLMTATELVSVMNASGMVEAQAVMAPGDTWQFYRGAAPAFQRVTCVAALGAAGQLNTQYVSGQGFRTIYLTATEDTHGAFNNQTGIYTVPRTGTYLVATKFRITDSVGSGISYGHGAHTENTDGAWFLWGVTAPMRNGSLNQRLVNLKRGDQLRMYAYVDVGGGLNLAAAEMTIILIGESGGEAVPRELRDLLDVDVSGGLQDGMLLAYHGPSGRFRPTRVLGFTPQVRPTWQRLVTLTNPTSDTVTGFYTFTLDTARARTDGADLRVYRYVGARGDVVPFVVRRIEATGTSDLLRYTVQVVNDQPVPPGGVVQFLVEYGDPAATFYPFTQAAIARAYGMGTGSDTRLDQMGVARGTETYAPADFDTAGTLIFGERDDSPNGLATPFPVTWNGVTFTGVTHGPNGSVDFGGGNTIQWFGGDLWEYWRREVVLQDGLAWHMLVSLYGNRNMRAKVTVRYWSTTRAWKLTIYHIQDGNPPMTAAITAGGQSQQFAITQVPVESNPATAFVLDITPGLSGSVMTVNVAGETAVTGSNPEGTLELGAAEGVAFFLA
ncbi:hypothetical protein [Deinococcus kurensis]|uniref:hypothetical protein n=1 Tax=Deinococcus kurensis TaxID=2662757 RepID=UPI0012D35559|nr:hypothetical protein [Deinococcus kurensis]